MGASAATSAVFAVEQPIVGWNLTGGAVPGGAAPEAPFLNTGVFLVRVASSSFSVRLFSAWLVAAAGAVLRRLWTSWPGEQGVLSELVRPGTYPAASTVAPR